MAGTRQLELLKQKYSSVFASAQQLRVQLNHVRIQDNKLLIQGFAPSEQAKNMIWDEIKRVDSNWARELSADIMVDPTSQTSAAAAGGQLRTYTVQLGDTLSRISRDVYGDAGSYMKIFEANRDVLNDPDKIRLGQTLKIPA